MNGIQLQMRGGPLAAAMCGCAVVWLCGAPNCTLTLPTSHAAAAGGGRGFDA